MAPAIFGQPVCSYLRGRFKEREHLSYQWRAQFADKFRGAVRIGRGILSRARNQGEQPSIVFLLHQMRAANVIGRHALDEDAVGPPPSRGPLRAVAHSEPLAGVGQERIEDLILRWSETELFQPSLGLGVSAGRIDDEIPVDDP